MEETNLSCHINWRFRGIVQLKKLIEDLLWRFCDCVRVIIFRCRGLFRRIQAQASEIDEFHLDGLLVILWFQLD